MTEKKRCFWAEGDELLRAYHDEEWGVPVHDDRRWFEKIVLDGAQAGLSWLTILRKREGYRRAFREFDPSIVARFSERDITRLLKDPGIVRNRAKIRSAIGNARAFLAIQDEHGTFDRYIWGYCDGRPLQGTARERERPACADPAVGSRVGRPEEARVHLRGIDHRVRVHAGGRPGE